MNKQIPKRINSQCTFDIKQNELKKVKEIISLKTNLDKYHPHSENNKGVTIREIFHEYEAVHL